MRPLFPIAAALLLLAVACAGATPEPATGLAYTQEGSFARYYIERHGLQAFLDLALDAIAYADQPELWQRLEAEWRGALAAR